MLDLAPLHPFQRVVQVLQGVDIEQRGHGRQRQVDHGNSVAEQLDQRGDQRHDGEQQQREL